MKEKHSNRYGKMDGWKPFGLAWIGL